MIADTDFISCEADRDGAAIFISTQPIEYVPAAGQEQGSGGLSATIERCEFSRCGARRDQRANGLAWLALECLQAASLRESARPAGTAKLGGHALYDAALNLVLLGLQYVVRVGRLPHALEEGRLSELPFST